LTVKRRAKRLDNVGALVVGVDVGGVGDALVGCNVGRAVVGGNHVVGDLVVGLAVGMAVGLAVGLAVGYADGLEVGVAVGSRFIRYRVYGFMKFAQVFFDTQDVLPIQQACGSCSVML
jgi:hypothetical protein